MVCHQKAKVFPRALLLMQWIQPESACWAGCAGAGRTGSEPLKVQSCPFSLDNRMACWWFEGLCENRKVDHTLHIRVGSYCAAADCSIVGSVSPWMVGGQTMSVCWKGSVWAQSWAGLVCRGTPCWVSPGMLMVACWYRPGW